MPTPEEIKRLAEQYAESKCPIQEYFRAYDKRDNLNEAYCKEALKVLEWLSNDYCIVPKKKIAYWQGIIEDALKAKPYITDLEFRYMWERLFGKELFNEDKEVNNA